MDDTETTNAAATTETTAEEATAVATIAVATATATDGSYNDDDFAPETDKPVILEIGSTLNINNVVTESVSQLYAADYPLDMHTAYLHGTQNHLHQHQHTTSFGEHPAIATLTSHLTLYNNPYAHHPHQHPSQLHQLQQPQHHHPQPRQLHTPPVHNVSNMPSYALNIPQTVCAWSTATSMTTTTTTQDVDRKSTPDVVPPAMYISYGGGTREHIISKEPNPVWKEKALQIEKDYKKTACDRERTRMRDMNRAFDLLRAKLPISKPNGKKYSKIESLRIAINYINHLQQCLRDGPPDLEITVVPSDMSNHTKTDQTHSAVEYVMEMDSRRCRQTFHYESRRRSYQLDIDKEAADEHNQNSWSDNSYVPNGNDWD